jgi:hypothetical protein
MSRMEAVKRHPRLAALVAALALAALVAAIVVLASNGGSDPDAGEPPPGRACTLIACSSGVTVRLSQPPERASSARVCVAGKCGRPRPLDPVAAVRAPLPEASRRAGARVNVVVELLDGEGRLVERLAGRATVTRSRPNGPDCPPVCFQAKLTLSSGH